MSDALEQLGKTLQARRNADPGESYVAQLHHAGVDKILEKVGEEAIEAILAAKGLQQAAGQANQVAEKSALISETADLWFHTLVMLHHFDCSAQDVLDELARRMGTSGLEEKAQRGK